MWLKNKRWMAGLLLIMAAFLLVACGKEEQTSKEEPAHVEAIEGSEFSLVTLTEKAAERLGIKTATVRADESMEAGATGGQVVMQQGEVTDATNGLVRVALDKSMMGKIDSSQPAHVLLQDDDEEEGFLAELFEPPDSDDIGDEDEDDSLYFTVDSVGTSLAEGQPVFVKLMLASGETAQAVIPYSAVIYGLHGETWAYTNPEPLTYVRQPITVEYIEGGQAFLSDGPPAGTSIVTVGAQLLYGAETGVGK